MNARPEVRSYGVCNQDHILWYWPKSKKVEDDFVDNPRCPEHPDAFLRRMTTQKMQKHLEDYGDTTRRTTRRRVGL